jgi:hypothetical protein
MKLNKLTRAMKAAPTRAVLLSVLLFPAIASTSYGDTTKATDSASPAMCAQYETHLQFLSANYGEHPVFSGKANGGVTLRLFANGSTGTWTVVFIRADGMSCVQAVGKNAERAVGL